MNTIHSRLKHYRTQKGFSIQEVSRRTGIPSSTYKEWENGRQIRGEPYAVLAETYQVSLQELITGRKTQAGPLLQRLDHVLLELQAVKSDLISRF